MRRDALGAILLDMLLNGSGCGEKPVVSSLDSLLFGGRVVVVHCLALSLSVSRQDLLRSRHEDSSGVSVGSEEAILMMFVTPSIHKT